MYGTKEKENESWQDIGKKTQEVLMVHKNSEKFYSERNFYRKKCVTKQWSFSDTVPDHKN